MGGFKMKLIEKLPGIIQVDFPSREELTQTLGQFRDWLNK